MRNDSVEGHTSGPLAVRLGARRDGSTAGSSRALLMTVLGEFVLPTGGSAWTQTLIAALEQSGIRDKATRQALARMEDRGWLTRERIGRRTRWTLTEFATGLLSSGAERIYNFGRQQRPWDGRWLVVLASIPERDRPARYRMAQGLGWVGCGSLGNGLWLSPWTDHEPQIATLLQQLEVDATTFRSELGRLGSGSELVAAAWDLPQLRAQYDTFLANTAPLVGEPNNDTDAVGSLTALVHEWRRFPFIDPELPLELMETDWPGPAAAGRFGQLRLQLQPPALDRWRKTESDNGPSL